MQGGRSLLGRRLGAWAVVAVLALLVRALIPVGYMLAASPASDRIEIVLCSGHASGAFLDLGASPDQVPNDGAQGDQPCIFALNGIAGEPPSLHHALGPIGALSLPASTTRPPEQTALDLAAPPPWATGPPLRL